MKLTDLYQLEGHRGAIYAMTHDAKKDRLYSADGNGWVVSWDMSSPKDGELIAQVPSNVFSLALLESFDVLALGSMQGVLYFIDLKTNQLLEPPVQLGGAIFDLKVQEELLWVATGDGALLCWDHAKQALVWSQKISDAALRAFSWDEQGNTCAIGSSDHKVHIWDSGSKEVTQVLEHHQNSVFKVLFSSTFSKQLTLWSGGRDAMLKQWQLVSYKDETQWQLTHSVPAHLYTINDMVLSEALGLLFTASRDKSIKVWNVRKDPIELLKVVDPLKEGLIAHKHSVNALLYLEDRNWLVSAGDDRRILIKQIEEVI